MLAEINKTPSKKTLREFGLIFAGMTCLMFGIILPAVFEWQTALWPWLLASLFVALAIVAPVLLKYPYLLWMHVGAVLGKINGTILLSLVYFLILAPMGVILKIRSIDPLKRSLEKNQDSYRVKNASFDRESMKRPF